MNNAVPVLLRLAFGEEFIFKRIGFITTGCFYLESSGFDKIA